jgi:transcriptional regulator GlxA family with amidase domain
LLGSSAHDLTAVATAAGFSNASNFARAFKQATGWTPAEYRQRNLGRA